MEPDLDNACTQKGNTSIAANYCLVILIGPLAKLFSTCLNLYLEREAQAKGWRAPTQAGFRQHHRLEDLVIAIDYIISKA